MAHYQVTVDRDLITAHWLIFTVCVIINFKQVCKIRSTVTWGDYSIWQSILVN
jgi:hypothetical protein